MITKVLIREDNTKRIDMSKGDMCRKTLDGVLVWHVCCPLCGTLGSLRNHSIVEQNNLITVNPSLICNAKDVEHIQCPGHYYIQNNQITYV